MQNLRLPLGNQVNILGQTAYLGYHHPLSRSKALFPISKLFLFRKYQPIDTLITGDNNLHIQDIDTELPTIKLTEFTQLNDVNTTDELAGTKFDITHISHVLQSQIAGDISQEILTEKISQGKSQTKKSTKSESKKSYSLTSSRKSRTEKAAKSSKPRKKRQPINQVLTNSDISEASLLSKDNEQVGVADLIDNYPILQQRENLESKTIDTHEIKTNNPILEDTLLLHGNISNEEIKLANPLEPADVETIDNYDTNIIKNEQAIAHQIPQNIDSLNINSNTRSNIIEENSFIPLPESSSTLIHPTLTEKDKGLEANSENVSSSGSAPITDTNPGLISNSNHSNLTNHQSLISDNISPENENIAPLFNHLSHADTQDIYRAFDIDHQPNQTKPTSEVIDSITTQNILEIPQQLTTDNLTTKFIGVENEELNLLSSITNNEDNISLNSEESIQPNQTIITSDIPSANLPGEKPHTLTEEILQPVIKSSIDLVPSTNILTSKPQNQEHRTTKLIENSPIQSELTTIQTDTLSPIISEIKQETIPESTEFTSVILSSVSAQPNINSLPEVTNIQPDSVSYTTPENEQKTITEPGELTSITPSFVSAKPDINSHSEVTTIQTNSTSSTAPENEQKPIRKATEFTSVIPSSVLAQADINSLSEVTNIQPDTPSSQISEIEQKSISKLTNIKTDTQASTPELTIIHSPAESSTISKIDADTNTPQSTPITPISSAPISAQKEEISTIDANIIKPDISEVPLTNFSEDLPIFTAIIENEELIQSDYPNSSNLGNTSNISQTVSPLDDQDNTSNLDIESNTVFNNLPTPKGYATGGQVTTTSVENHQPVAPSDTVPAMLTPGEFVINAKDAQKNLHVLKHINAGGSAEQIISPSLDTHSPTPTQTNLSQPTTKVDSFIDTPLQRQTVESDTFLDTSPLNTPSLGEEITKQRLTIVNSPAKNTVANTSNTQKESSPHYSSPSLIFRKPHPTNNTETPSQWSNVEELLSGGNEQFTNFIFSSVDNNWENSSSPQFVSSSPRSNVLAQRLPIPQGFANGGEVIAPDISTDFAPTTETIQNPYTSLPTETNNDSEDEKLEVLAQEIYHRLRQRIEIERERQGIYVGRLPW